MRRSATSWGLSPVCGKDPAEAEEALARFGLGRFAGRSVRELSLGQKRRATFAAALVGSPAHILLDEPLEAMDRRAQGPDHGLGGAAEVAEGAVRRGRLARAESLSRGRPRPDSGPAGNPAADGRAPVPS